MEVQNKSGTVSEPPAITREQFIKTSMAVGVGAFGASFLAGCSDNTAVNNSPAQNSGGTPPSGAATPGPLPESSGDYTPPPPAQVEDLKPDAASSLVLEPANGRLGDKIAVVTGASSGIGREIARLFAREGAKVVAVARRENRLEALATESQDYPGEIAAFKADLSDRTQVKQAIQFALDTYGRIDILVNNAGTMGNFERAASLTEGNWDYTLAVNTTAPMLTIKWSLQGMLEQGAGVIINIASIGGLQGTRAGVEYAASKHAVVGLTRNTAFMYAKEGIRCNAICPGGVNTEIFNSVVSLDQTGFEIATSGGNLSPATADPMQIAACALFLATDSAGFVNGATLVPDAGWTAY
jgi:NAD(P)-dependent dehydrogenase (short-subunit alcohol dehydrogenase family)